MSDEAALLAAICAQPNEDTLRLAYADWLDEHGQPERAELIRVQCALAHTPVEDDARTDLEVREMRLLAKNAAEWAHPRPAFPDFLPTTSNDENAGYQSVFRRGLLERVGWHKLAPEHLAPGGEFERLFAAHPVRDLRLQYFAPGVLAALAERPELGRIKALGLRHPARWNAHTAESVVAELEAFLREAPLTRLTDMELHLCPTQHLGGQLLRLPFFSRLRALKVGRGKGEHNAFWDALVSGWCPNLTDLEVRWGIGRESPEVGRRFAESDVCKGLRRLSVAADNQVTPFPWAEVFARAPLEELQVTAGTGTNAPELLAALASTPATGRLRRLHIFGINTTGAGFAQWLRTGYATGVRELELEYTWFDDSGLRELAEAPELARLTRLNLSGYSMCTADGLCRLLLSPHLTGLRHLEIESEALTADVLRDFARHGACRGLRVLTAWPATGDSTPQTPAPAAWLGLVDGLPFPHLHTLRAVSLPDDRHPDELRALLDSPNLPNLSALRIGLGHARRADWEHFAAESRLAWVGGNTGNEPWGRVAIHPRNVFLPNHLDGFGI